MSKFLENLPAVPALSDTTEFAVSYTDESSYKATLDDISTYIGIHTTLVPPVELQDVLQYYSSNNIITITGTGDASVLDITDYANIEVGDIIVLDSQLFPVVSKPGGFQLVVDVPSGIIPPPDNFDCGKASILSLPYISGPSSYLSTRGLATTGSVSAANADIATVNATTIDVNNVNAEDTSAWVTGIGTITCGAVGSAIVTNATDHSNLSVGDMFYAYSGSTIIFVNIIIAKSTYPVVTVLPSSVGIPDSSFQYGKYSLLCKDSSSDIRSAFSTIGAVSSKGMMAPYGDFKNLISDTATIDTSTIETATIDTIEAEEIVVGDNLTTDGITDYISTAILAGHSITNDLKMMDTSRARTIQRNKDDGCITTPYQPSFCTKRSNNLGIGSASWSRINFNVFDGSDTEGITHCRVPYGKAGWNATYGVFEVPYDAGYSTPQSYTISVSVRTIFQCTSAGGTFWVKVSGTSGSGSLESSGFDLLQARTQVDPAVTTNYDVITSVSGTIRLDPLNIPNHRFLSVWTIRSTNISASFVYASSDGQTFFSGACNG